MTAALQQRPRQTLFPHEFRPDFNITIEPGHEEMWLAIRDLPNHRGGFTAAELAQLAGAKESTADRYLRHLVAQGAAIQVGLSEKRSTVYGIPKLFNEPVVLDDRGEPSRDYAIRRKLWTVMRMRPKFTVKDLWEAVREHVTVTRKQVTLFVTHLEEAGYLAALYGEGREGAEEFKLKPARNTGPMPPRLCEAALVYDLNERAFYGTALAREVRL